MGTAQHIEHLVQTDVAYVWAKSPQNGGRITEMHDALKTEIIGNGGKISEFLATDMKSMRRSLGADGWHREAVRFLGVEASTAALIQACTELLEGHRAIKAVSAARRADTQKRKTRG